MRFVVLGNLEIPIRCATAVLDAGGEVCAIISMPEHTRRDNSTDVAGFARGRNIAYHEIEDINSPESVGLIRGITPDYILSIRPQMIKRAVLDIPRIRSIGTHPTALPFNRERHPLHWLISLGIAESKMSFFRMEEPADTGNVLLQVPYQIGPEDSIGKGNAMMDAASYEGTVNLHKKLLDDPAYPGFEQDHALANTWRKQTPHNVTLDPRISSDMILRTVRSFAPPYPGANLIFQGHVLKVSSASIAEIAAQMESEQIQRIEPGTVIYVKGNRVGMKVEDTIVVLECAGQIPPRLSKAKYTHPPTKYLAERPDFLAA